MLDKKVFQKIITQMFFVYVKLISKRFLIAILLSSLEKAGLTLANCSMSFTENGKLIQEVIR